MADRLVDRWLKPRFVLPALLIALAITVILSPVAEVAQGPLLTTRSRAVNGSRGLREILDRLGWRTSERIVPFSGSLDSTSTYFILNTPIDPSVCFNHASSDKADVCSACGLSFCGRCLTPFQNTVLCTVCKNYRSRLLQRRPDTSKLALASLFVALGAGPAMLAFTASPAARNFVLLGLIPSLLALAAGVLALRWIRNGPYRAGVQLAISGISLAGFVGVLTVMLAVYGSKVWG